MPANGLVLSAMVEDNSESLILSWVFWTRLPMSIGNSRAGPLLRCFSRYGFLYWVEIVLAIERFSCTQ